MCLAVPAKLVQLDADCAVADLHGNRITISTMLTPDVELGDWVLVHAGFAIQRLDPAAAAETFAILNDVERVTNDGVMTCDDSKELTMHELSIAEALLEQVRRHTPPGHRAIMARVEAGAYQGIDPIALDMAWQAIASDEDVAGTQLVTQILPYELNCPECRRKWTSSDPFDVCDCGAEALCAGTSDLRLISLEIEPVDSAYATATSCPEVDHAY